LAKLSDQVRLLAEWLDRWILCASRMALIALSELTSSVTTALCVVVVEDKEEVEEVLLALDTVVLVAEASFVADIEDEAVDEVEAELLELVVLSPVGPALLLAENVEVLVVVGVVEVVEEPAVKLVAKVVWTELRESVPLVLVGLS
jgi:hypothetical protein